LIEETNETKEKGKYIVVVPGERVESAQTAMGKCFKNSRQAEEDQQQWHA
jgi:hypothetical protein